MTYKKPDPELEIPKAMPVSELAGTVLTKPRNFSRSSKVRLSTTLGPAALMTFGLFAVMASLIATDFQPVEASEVRTIQSIVPEKIDEAEITSHEPFKLLETVAAPPPPPQYTISKDDVTLPVPVFTDSVRKDLLVGPIQKLETLPVAIIDTDATPLRPPVVAYPSIAILREIEGECQVVFDVDTRGRPFNIEPNCSDDVFTRAAKKAISRVEFAPKIQQGRASERKNVVYPIVFSLGQ